MSRLQTMLRAQNAMDEKAFFWVLRIDGIPFTFRSYCANKRSMMYWCAQHVNQRNSNIPHERTEFVGLYELGVDMSLADAEAIERKNEIDKANNALPLLSDIDPEAYNRIFHQDLASGQSKRALSVF